MNKSPCSFFSTFIVLMLTSIFSLPTIAAGTQHVVEKGDTLSKLAERYYDNSKAWITIYQANRDRIKDDGNLVKIGSTLTIPELVNEEIANQVATDEAVQEQATKIFLVTGDNYAPFAGKDLPKQGMFTEVVDIIFKRLGYDPEVQFMDWKNGFEMTYQRGVFAATFPYLKNEERKRKFYYSEPIFEMLIFAYHDVKSNHRYRHEEDLKGRKVCRPQGYYTHDLDKLIDANIIELIRPDDIDECFEMLVAGNVDFVIVNEMTGNQQIVEQGLRDRVEPSDKIMSIEGLYVIFPKSTSNGRVLQYQFNQELEKMQNSGELNRIIQKHVNLYYESMMGEEVDKIDTVKVEPSTDTLPTESPIRSSSEF